MNSSLILHLARKDLSAFRGPWILVSLMILVVALLPIGGAARFAETVALLPVPTFILLFLLQTLVLQLDPTRGAEHFLTTRPVPRRTILLSKFAVFWAVGIVPMLAAELIQVARAHLDLPLSGYLWLLFQCFLCYLGIAGLAAMLSIFTRTIAQFITALAGIIIAFVILSTALPVPQLRPSPPSNPDAFHTLPYLLLSLCGVVAYAIVWARCLKRSWTAVVFLAFGWAGLSVAGIRYWNISLAPAAPMKVAALPASKDALDNVVVEWSPAGPTGTEGKTMDGLRVWFNAGYTAKNLPPGCFLFPTGHQSTAEIPGGEKQASSLSYSGRSVLSLGVSSESLSTLLGMPITVDPRFDNAGASGLYVTRALHQTTQCFRGQRSGLPAGERRATLTGSCDFTVYQPFIAAELPMKVGASYAKDGYRLEILTVRKGGTNLHVDLSQIGLPSWLSDSNRWRGRGDVTGDYLLCLANPVTKEFIAGRGATEGFMGPSESSHLMMSDLSVAQLSLFRPLPKAFENDQDLDPGWLANIKLYVIEVKPVGTLSRPFEFKDVSLNFAPADAK